MTILKASSTGQMEGGASFSLGNRIVRAVWIFIWLLFARWTPPPLHFWRRWLLRCFGARIGRGVRVYGAARVWYPAYLKMEEYAVLGPGANCYNQGPIHIGARAIISQGAHLCAGSHDISDPNFQILVRPIRIEERAWIAAEAFVGPGVTIGAGAVVAARAVVMRDVPGWQVFAGNPAVFIKERRLRDRK